LGEAGALSLWFAGFHRQRSVLADLDAADQQVRKEAAWAIAERPFESAVALVRQRLGNGAEPSADVRESLVYALGYAGSRIDYDLLRRVSETDASGYVRQAALLAAARIDPDRCRRHVAQPAPVEAGFEAWDSLGRAQARLVLGDAAGVPPLLEHALGKDASRRQVACRALYKWLRPALVSAGRWPLDARVQVGETWPDELVRTVAQRCAELDLDRLLTQTRLHEQRSSVVRRNTARLTGARERLARILFAGP
jgi:hypothetical protein